MTTVEPEYFMNPKTQRMVKKSESSRTYKKLLKDKVIDGPVIVPKRKPRKTYKFAIKKDEPKDEPKEEPKEESNKKKISYDAPVDDSDSNSSDYIDENDLINLMENYIKSKIKK